MILTQILVFALMIDAAWVAIGLARKKNMWRWIILYWVILTLKNLVDAGGLLV